MDTSERMINDKMHAILGAQFGRRKIGRETTLNELFEGNGRQDAIKKMYFVVAVAAAFGTEFPPDRQFLSIGDIIDGLVEQQDSGRDLDLSSPR